MVSSSQQIICNYLSPKLGQAATDVSSAYNASPRNVQVILSRQLAPTTKSSDRKICMIDGEDDLLKALAHSGLEAALFTLARIYDEAHMILCQSAAVAKRKKEHNTAFLANPQVDVRLLATALLETPSKINDSITLGPLRLRPNVLQATWIPIVDMSFDQLPILPSLSNMLPGEQSPAVEYAGIGGGGGSDIVSASLLGHLLRGAGKEMNLLISTRTWRTGSQGKKGSKMGIKREIHNHGGAATAQDGQAVGGTYRIRPETRSEGRDLETIPVHNHEDVFIVLDQGEEISDVDDADRADLSHQFLAVLSQRELGSIIVIDTGGDVFGSDSPAFSTPDQDIRVQNAIAKLKYTYPNLVTAVLAPGVDAPSNAPEKARKAGGKVYKPTANERNLLLDLLAREYQMDGSNPDRFGKTTLCLQERLRGTVGWTSLNLPEHVVNTWENPWSSFAFIRECMSDIILMPLVDLLPLIDVKH